MDTNKIKKFATEARNILKAGIAARLTALGFDHKGQVPENNLKCATKPFNVLLACTHPLITDYVEQNCSMTRKYSSKRSELLRFNMYFCHVYLKKIVMKQIIKRGSFFTLMFMLLGCLSLYAADNDLITEQITIELEKAGTLPGRIGGSKKYKITNLKIIGEINGTDLNMIREMAGRNSKGDSTYGKLSVLDLSEAKIVEGGDCYYYDDADYYYTSECYTSNDVIGSYAFSGCSGLTSLTLPAGITEIGDRAFYGCSGLTSLTLPDGITKIGDRTFYDCSGLTSLTLPDGITKISGGTFWDCSGLTSLTLPDGITEIGSEAFRGCSGLTSLTLPDGITEIYNGTFYGCSGLTSLTLPAGITEIDSEAFYGCSGLTSVYVYAEKVPKIYSDVFLGVDAKKCTLYVPMGTRDDYRFSGFGYYFENIVEFDATGIDKTTTSTDVEEVGRYSVNGQRLSAPTKGLNIVKYSDGSVKKVAVR